MHFLLRPCFAPLFLATVPRAWTCRSPKIQFIGSSALAVIWRKWARRGAAGPRVMSQRRRRLGHLYTTCGRRAARRRGDRRGAARLPAGVGRGFTASLARHQQPEPADPPGCTSRPLRPRPARAARTRLQSIRAAAGQINPTARGRAFCCQSECGEGYTELRERERERERGRERKRERDRIKSVIAKPCGALCAPTCVYCASRFCERSTTLVCLARY